MKNNRPHSQREQCLKMISEFMVQIPLKSEWNYKVKSVSHPTEPANYRSSYSSASKEVVDIKIALCQSACIIVTTAIELLLLLKLTQYPRNKKKEVLDLTLCSSSGRSLPQVWLVVFPSLGHQGSLLGGTPHERPFH